MSLIGFNGVHGQALDCVVYLEHASTGDMFDPINFLVVDIKPSLAGLIWQYPPCGMWHFLVVVSYFPPLSASLEPRN
jgi:hypothetical protein